MDQDWKLILAFLTLFLSAVVGHHQVRNLPITREMGFGQPFAVDLGVHVLQVVSISSSPPETVPKEWPSLDDTTIRIDSLQLSSGQSVRIVAHTSGTPRDVRTDHLLVGVRCRQVAWREPVLARRGGR